MTTVAAHLSVSIDGFIAGPNQSLDDPIGRGGADLHTWHRNPANVDEIDRQETDLLLAPMGAYVMGRNMFGPIRGEWSDDWRGWWGDDPPYHAPVFVLTHYPRESIEMAGGTTFHFVTDGFDAAMQRARDAAGDREIRIAGGASTIYQALEAGVLDELYVAISPIALGSGESLFPRGVRRDLTQRTVRHSPRATFIHYRVT